MAKNENTGDLKYGLAIAGFAGVFWCVVAPFATPLSFAEVGAVGLGFAVLSGVGSVVKRKARRGALEAGIRAQERKLEEREVEGSASREPRRSRRGRPGP